MTNNTRTLTEILADFQKGHTKVAEDEEYSNIVPADAVAAEEAVPAEAVCEDGESCEVPEEDYEADGEGVTATDLTDAAEAVKENEDQTVDAAKELREIADEYIEAHNDALEKEASLFGEIFAKSAMMTMQSDAAMQEAYVKTASMLDEDDGEDLFMKIAEEAYDTVNAALAGAPAVEEEAEPVVAEDAEPVVAVADEGAEEIPEWLQNTVENNSDALAEQTENIGELVDDYLGGEEGEDVPAEVVEKTAEEAYYKVAQALAEGSDPRLEEEVDDSTEVEEEGDESEGYDRDVSGDDKYEDDQWMVEKTAEEAYDKVVEALDAASGDSTSVAEDEAAQAQDEEVPQETEEDEAAEEEAEDEAAEDIADEVVEKTAEEAYSATQEALAAEDEAETGDLRKTAEEAYDAANAAMAAEDAAAAPATPDDVPPWLQKAMMTNANALKEQTETLNDLAESYAAPAPEADMAAQDAYDATNAALQGGDPNAMAMQGGDPQMEAAQQAYDATNAAVQQPVDPSQMAAMQQPMQPQPGGMM